MPFNSEMNVFKKLLTLRASCRILFLNMFNIMTKPALTTKAEATRNHIVDLALDLFRLS